MLTFKRHRTTDESTLGELLDEQTSRIRKGEKKKTKKDREPDAGHGWTQGQRLASTAATVGVWALCLSGPVALVSQLSEEPPPAPAAVQKVAEPSEAQRASQWAASFMQIYLTTPRGEEKNVTELFAKGAVSTLQLSKSPAPIGAVTPGSAVEVGDGQWVATVSVHEPARDGVPATTRYWQVPLLMTEEGEIAASALPSLIAAPVAGSASVDRGDSIAHDEIKTLTSNFASAYLAGSGDVKPLVSPGAPIHAVTPAPYSEAEVRSLSSRTPVPETPKNGDSARVQISVVATAANGNETHLDYLVEVTYRDRWEIAAINPTTQGVK